MLSPNGIAAESARVAALLLMAQAGPVLAGLLVRRRSIARDRVPEAWFNRAHDLNLLMAGGWVLWVFLVEASGVNDYPALGWSGLVLGPLWWLGFLPAAFVLMAIMRNVVHRLRGHDPMPRGIGRVHARMVVVLGLLVVALGLLGAGNLRAGVFTLLGAVAASLLMPGARGPMGMAPQALSSGALRDRLFEMAGRARVKVRELYVVPMRRERLANAFAVQGGMVMVADEMLDRMSRREVDATLAHELSHLARHHPRKTMLASAVACFAGVTIGVTLGIAVAAPLGVALAFLAGLFAARRFEFSADAGAAALTGDPEAVIACLGHLSRINQVPLAWRRARGWLITHPSTEARGLAVGRRAGIDPARVRELLEQGLPPGEGYGRAERPGEEGRVYSTAWKAAVVGRLSLAFLATAVAAPAVALAIALALGVEPPHLIAILAAGALGLAAALFVQDRFAAGPVAGLEASLRRRLDAEGGGASSLFVALSPGDRTRVYEGFFDWDLGLLAIEPDRLRYRGEQVTLDLPRRFLTSIEIGADAPGWARAPRVVLRWSAPDGEQCLTLRAADARRVSAIGLKSRALVARLKEWRDAGAASAAFGEGDFGPPGIGPVTSLAPADAAAPRDLPVLLVLVGLLSAAASFACGLGFWRGVDVFVAAMLALFALRWPAMTAREASPAAKEPKAEAERRAA